MVRVVSLRVKQAVKSDIGQNIARLDGQKRKELGIELYDAVVIRSEIGICTSIVKQAKANDIDKNVIRLDKKQRDTLGVKNGDIVNVINYLDYKIEEEKLKPEPLLKKDLKQIPSVQITNIKESVIQRSTVGGTAEGEIIQGNSFCPKCGAQLSQDFSFCPKCGEGL